MEDNKFVKIFIGVIILVILSCAAYLFFTIFGNKKEASGVSAFNKFDEHKKEIYASKLTAYNDLLNDSLVKIREENITVDLSKLFSSGRDDSINSKPSPLPYTSDVTPVAVNKKSMLPVSVTGYQGTSNESKKPVAMKNNVDLHDEKAPVIDAEPRRRTGFNSSFKTIPAEDQVENSEDFNAVVHTRQEIHEGSTVKIRTISPILIEGYEIPSNTFIYGIASIFNERVRIILQSVSFQGKILSVDYSAYDKDGIQGIYIPDLKIHDASGEIQENALNEAAFNVPAVGRIPLNVIRKKNNIVTAILTDGYRLIFK
ncbi:MAG: conjugative transposon protein TraM [Bacteroidales bacterium]